MANTTKTNIESILKQNMEQVEQLMNQGSQKYDFGIKDGKIQFTGYVGKRGARAKAYTSYVRVYLDKVPVKGLTYSPVQTVSSSGNIYSQPAWSFTKSVKTDEIIAMFQEIAETGARLYKEAHK